MCIVVIGLVLASQARADDGVTIEGYVVDGVIAEGVVVYADHVLPHALVRIVGERVVVIGHADAKGHVHVNGLAPGKYRIELEHGALADHAPVREQRTLTVDDWRHEHWCVLPIGNRTFPSVLGAAAGSQEPAPRLGAKRRPFIDTSSSALETSFVFVGH